MLRLATIAHDRCHSCISVPAITLDIAADLNGMPDVIKIDIEGAELLALRGAHRVLRERKPVLLVEVHTPEIGVEFYPLLENYGYRFFRLNGQKIVDREYVRFVMAK